MEQSTENPHESPKERYRQWYAKYHPHPMAVHFPIALHYFSGFADILFLADPSEGYEAAVFLSFLIATVTGLFALISGIFSWWINYNFAVTKVFMIKLAGGVFTLMIGLIPIAQRMADPDVAYSADGAGIVYHAIIFMTVISVSVVGYYGGKLTWRAKR
ncbi:MULTISPECIES: DUF2231 domain-containing protein [unclassified Sulfuricurvum]|uniref:DUF2231 domain-containing protein n=1 Tax=unclassified Sulfuricurvum TaxID=2632390 RepID=UPI000A53F388|nr:MULTISPECIES: DUF2231 domain-containing protein [unclassified Sulfuricurvum]